MSLSSPPTMGDLLRKVRSDVLTRGYDLEDAIDTQTQRSDVLITPEQLRIEYERRYVDRRGY